MSVEEPVLRGPEGMEDMKQAMAPNVLKSLLMDMRNRTKKEGSQEEEGR